VGTFHDDKHELHGTTIVVDTTGDEIFIGRCDDIDEREVILLDVDVHRNGDEGRSKEDYVQYAAQIGFWKKYDRVVIASDKVVSVRRLGDL
jgi:hypothetical protein